MHARPMMETEVSGSYVYKSMLVVGTERQRIGWPFHQPTDCLLGYTHLHFNGGFLSGFSSLVIAPPGVSFNSTVILFRHSLKSGKGFP